MQRMRYEFDDDRDSDRDDGSADDMFNETAQRDAEDALQRGEMTVLAEATYDTEDGPLSVSVV
jgi:hypothetical protein